MSWVEALYRTYENNLDKVNNPKDKVRLLPLCHTTQKAHIAVVLDEHGRFKRADNIVKDEANTVIPCTESSQSRAGASIAPHVLFDKLCYVAGDYLQFGGKASKCGFNEYIKQLQKWCQSGYAHKKVCIILKYLQESTLISDLVNHRILYCDEDNKLLAKWNGEADLQPEIFRNSPDQSEAFVRFTVEIMGEATKDLWEDKSMVDSFINYQNSIAENKALCYVQGKIMPTSRLSPAKIRNSGDSGKLISANDSSGFTYRGRFDKKDEAYNVGFDTTHKAHSALRWLVWRQGRQLGSQAVIAWSPENKRVPPPAEGSWEMYRSENPEDSFLEEDSKIIHSTNESFARSFNKMMSGYHQELGKNDEIVVMSVDSATPGRLAVVYYRRLTGSEFLERIENWHESCTWMLSKPIFGKNAAGKDVKIGDARFIGAPSPKDIMLAAYGNNPSDNLKSKTTSRLLACIIDGARLPRDIMLMATHHASRTSALEGYQKTIVLNTACALIRKYYNEIENRQKPQENGGIWKVSLDVENKDRDYLFGRALAYAQRIEEYALWTKGDKSRETNAERLRHHFSMRPAKTWKNLSDKLSPYLKSLHGKGDYFKKEMDSIISEIAYEDFNDKPLSPKYLLGYSSQRDAFWQEKPLKDEIKQESLEQEEQE